MRMCGSCGASNADSAEFCGSCGAFLEFDEAAPVTVAQQAPADTPAATDIPAAVQPDVTVQRKYRAVETVDDRPKPGDILCPACGAGNAAERRFCRRCGRSLVGGVPVRTSWWRRVLSALRGKPLAAGSRPRRRRRSVLPTIVLLLLVAVGLSYLPSIRPSVLRVYDTARGAVQDRFSQPTQVVPRSATASSATAGAGPELLIDGANDTYWAPKTPAPAKDEWCRLQLDRPTYVAKLLITTGIDTKEEAFRTQARPATIEITIRRVDGSETKRTVELNDRPKAQEVNLRAGRVTQITITIKDSYGVQTGRRVAIAEIEVFARR